MKNLSRHMSLIAVLFYIFLPQTVTAHNVRIYAWAQGTTVYGETSFSGGRKPHDAKITVFNAATHAIISHTRTDNKGTFHVAMPVVVIEQHPDLLLVIDAGEGHRGQWLLPASEYLASGAGQPLSPAKSRTIVKTGQTKEKAVSLKPLDEQALRNMIDQELELRLAPLKQMIARQSVHTTDLRDILGGIGYIFGLAGIIAWLKAGSKEKQERQ